MTQGSDDWLTIWYGYDMVTIYVAKNTNSAMIQQFCIAIYDPYLQYIKAQYPWNWRRKNTILKKTEGTHKVINAVSQTVGRMYLEHLQ